MEKVFINSEYWDLLKKADEEWMKDFHQIMLKQKEIMRKKWIRQQILKKKII